jgi:hypothetical protein
MKSRQKSQQNEVGQMRADTREDDASSPPEGKISDEIV